MAFYTVIHHIRENRIKPEQLDQLFWDYVLLGKGKANEVSEKTGIKEEILEKMRREFEYWYPNDQRHTAVGHITNHLTFFIFHHAAIFPEDHWPKGISINEYVIREGAKMSKSKGNVIPLVDIPRKYFADLYSDYTKYMDTQQEINFAKLDKFSKWFLSKINEKIKLATQYIENMEIRKYVQTAFFELLSEANYYTKRARSDVKEAVLSYLANRWIRLLSPVIPHVCEELWERLDEKGFVSLAEWPKPEEELINKEIMKLEETFRRTLEDIDHLIKLGRKKGKAYRKLFIYPATGDELNYFTESLEYIKQQFGFEEVEVFLASDEKKYDPENKAEKSKEGRPGIYLE